MFLCDKCNKFQEGTEGHNCGLPSYPPFPFFPCVFCGKILQSPNAQYSHVTVVHGLKGLDDDTESQVPEK